MDNETFEKMKAAKKKYHPIAMNIPGVHGTSIGFKEIGGKLTDTMAIRVHLTQKKPLDQLLESERLPEIIEGFPIDVFEHGQPKPHAGSNDNKYRPIPCGSQLSVERDSREVVGTLGCFVMYKDEKIYCLSNQHVLNQDDVVYQPTTWHWNRIGTTKRALLNQYIDAAICSIDYYDDEPKFKFVDGLHVGLPYNLTSADIGKTQLRKYGRTTGLTTGVLTGLNYDGIRSDGWEYTDQFEIQGDSFFDHGDSGSVITLMQGNVVGLLWGGDIPGGIGAASPIYYVEKYLDVSILGGS